jgi:hypothetical protein
VTRFPTFALAFLPRPSDDRPFDWDAQIGWHEFTDARIEEALARGDEAGALRLQAEHARGEGNERVYQKLMLLRLRILIDGRRK